MVKPIAGHIDYRPDVDGLRAVAVLAVVLHHAQVPFFSGGYVGVDVFFVISGYLITKLIYQNSQRGKFSFGEFYSRRVKRLLPAMFATIFLTVAASAFIMGSQDFSDLGKSVIYSILSIANVLFWLEAGYFEPDALTRPMLHMWSLSVEEQFYLVWPAVFVALIKLKASRWALLSICLGVAVASTVSAELILTNNPGAAYFLLPFRAAELAIGAALVFLPAPGPGLRLVATGAGAIGLVAIATSIVVYTPDTRFPGINALIPTLGTAALIWSGRVSLVSRFLSLRPIVFIGLISYSYYLVHWPMIVLYAYQSDNVILLREAAVLVVASGLVATIFYYGIEQPFRRGYIPLLATQPGMNLSASLFALVLVAGSSHVWALNGLRAAPEDDPMSLIRASAERRSIEESRIQQMEALHNSGNGRGRIAIVGDSHSYALYDVALDWGLSNNVVVRRIHVSGGCPHLLGVRVFGNEQQSALCNARTDAALQAVANGEFDVVILVARWGLYTSNVTRSDRAVRPPEFNRRVRSIALDGQAGYSADLQASRTAFEAGLVATIELLQSSGTQVLFIGQPPPIGSAPHRCIEQQTSIAEVQANCASAPYEERQEEAAWATEAARRIASDLGFTLIDPFEIFCQNQDCILVDRLGFYYSDGDHLSRRGAELLGARVFEAVASPLGSPRNSR